jgi:t-SNARE complex subunit (syntaxin)
MLQELDKQVNRFEAKIGQYSKAIDEVGTDRDTTKTRKKIEKFGSEAEDISKAIQRCVADASQSEKGNRAFSELSEKYEELQYRYDGLKTKGQRKVKENPLRAQVDENGDGGGGGGGGGGMRFNEQRLVQYDTGELRTEEAIQREKLEGVVEIEQDLNELKTAYQDFGQLVKDQQEGLNKVENNVDTSTVRVDEGIVELKKASKEQKSSRKKLCILLILLVVAIAIVVIVVVVKK